VRALFVQQDHVSPVGPIGEQFARRGYEVEEFVVVPEDRFHSPGVEVTFPDPCQYDAIIPMGAPWSVYDTSAIGAWVLEELDFLRRAQAASVPVLAICFGAQALATALGGSVERAPAAEVGWRRVDSSEPDLIEAGPWFQWHHDRWTPPPAARTLASTELAPQAFTVGRSLAVQFHPEITVAMLVGWLDNGGGEYLRAAGTDPAELLAQTRDAEAASLVRAARLVNRFLDVVAAKDLR